MPPHHRVPVAFFVLALTGCATAPSESLAIPSDREVASYVTTNWDDYDHVFAYRSGREGQSAVLVSVTNVECGPDDEDAKCTFVIRGRFGDGTVVNRRLESLFGRQPDGSIGQLLEVIPAHGSLP